MLADIQHVLYRSAMGIGRRIKARLNELGEGQAWLANRASNKDRVLSEAALSAIIKRDSIRSEFIGQIAEALGVNVRWLVYGKGPKLREESVATPTQDRSPYSPEAMKLAELFDELSTADRRSAWPWLVRLLSPGQARPEAFLSFPDFDRRAPATEQH